MIPAYNTRLLLDPELRAIVNMNPYSVSLICTALAGAAVGLFVRRWRRTAPVHAFPLLMFALSWWSFTYGMEVASTDLDGMQFWIRLQYPGIATAPVLWLIFSAQYAGKDRWLRWPGLSGLFVVPLLSVVLVWTNKSHSFFYRDVALDPGGVFPFQALTPGPGYWIHVVFSYACMVGGTLVIFSIWLRSATIYRRQAGIMLLGASVPFAANIIYLSGIRPFGYLDITPFAFTVTGIIVALGLFHYKLFDLLPLARDVLLENLKDGIIVADVENRVVEINPTAGKLLGIEGETLLGRDVSLVLARYPVLAALFYSGRETRQELVLRADPLLVMDAWLSPVIDNVGSEIGGLLVLRDITAAKKAEDGLRRVNERLELLLHSLPQAVLVIEANTQRILDVNPQACILLGLPSERIAGKTCHSFISPKEECACPMTEEGKTMDRTECVIINAEGEEIPVLKTALAVDVDGDRWLIECISDITELRRAELERLEKEKLQALVETAGAVCHEMNQPLMAVSAYGELCLMDLEEEHPAFSKIQKIVEQAGRMARITRKLTTVTNYRTRSYLKGKILDINSDSDDQDESGPSF